MYKENSKEIIEDYLESNDRLKDSASMKQGLLLGLFYESLVRKEKKIKFVIIDEIKQIVDRETDSLIPVFNKVYKLSYNQDSDLDFYETLVSLSSKKLVSLEKNELDKTKFLFGFHLSLNLYEQLLK